MHLYLLFLVVQKPLMCQGRLTIKTARSHSVSQLSVGILWTSHQPDSETSTWQQKTFTRDRHPCLRRDSNPQSQQDCGRPILCRGRYNES